MQEQGGADAGHKPLITTYLIEGLGVTWVSLKKVELFTHEIVKRLGAHERGRVCFERHTGIPEQPACTVLCGIARSEIAISTYPEHRYARMLVSTVGEPDVDTLDEVFREFFHPAAQMEGYIESPEL